jgi:hypothetical protein
MEIIFLEHINTEIYAEKNIPLMASFATIWRLISVNIAYL